MKYNYFTLTELFRLAERLGGLKRGDIQTLNHALRILRSLGYFPEYCGERRRWWIIM